MSMYAQEIKRITHIMVLLGYTILSVAVIGYSVTSGGDPAAAVILIFGLAVCWGIHFTQAVPAPARLWIYTAILMLTFFFFGTREQSIFDSTPVMLALILVYTPAEDPRFVRVCAVTYYFTMCYDLAFVPVGSQALPSYPVGRIALHFVIVFLSERVSEAAIQKLRRERINTEEIISRLEEANQSAEDFLANVSHELRTPINAVTGITAAMLKSEEDAEKRENLSSIQLAGNQLFDQIEGIMDYSEIDTGRIHVIEEAYTIPSLVNDIIIESQHMKRPLDVELIFDIDPKIPAVLLGDGRKIKKILRHLIDNAVKFTKRGGAYIRIYALSKIYGVNLCIRVSDTGVGIAGEELEKITEKFFQSNGGRNRKNRGLGLGLPIVYGLVGAMDGFVQIESREGTGTVVSVSIPQKVADAGCCMEIDSQADRLGLALYLRPEKYVVPELRDYYNAAISHMVQELDLTAHRVFELEELKRLISAVKLSHLLIGDVEYGESTSYFEQLGKSVQVVVVAGENFHPVQNSRMKVVRKPFYNLPIINVLNSTDSSKDDMGGTEILTCPGVRVLIVDDEPMNLLVAEDLLQTWNMKVETAGSGMEAIELCKNAEFDLIFLDHMMPEMDGVETLRELRKLWADTDHQPVVIAFSANVVSGAREMFLREGFDEFISKPIVSRELERLLRKVLPGEAIVYAVDNDGEDQTVTGRRRLEKNGFRVEDGLQYCNHDGAFYEEMLMRFSQESERKISQLDTALQKEDLRDYQILVHALKSSSKMVGAAELSEMAKNAEEAAKNRDAGYIHERHGTLLAKYREMARCVHDALSPAEAASAAAEISKTELLRYLSELKGALDTYESRRADALFAELDGFGYRDASVRELLREVRQAVDDFEWGSASEKLETLIDSLKGGETF